MGGTFGSFLALILIPTIGLFILGLIFVGRFIIVRYVLWTISGVFALLAILSVFNHIQHNNSLSKHCVGVYKLDLTTSKFDTLNLNSFANLTLKIEEDYTFTINNTSPFFPSQTGTWDYNHDGDLVFISCYFNNSNKKIEIQDGYGTWTFRDHDLLNGNGGDQIRFVNIDTLWQKKLQR